MFKMSQKERSKRELGLHFDIGASLPSSDASKTIRRGPDRIAKEILENSRAIETSRIQEDFWLRVRCGLRI
jgi:hypothetical protein